MDESKIYLGYDERTNAHLEYMGQWYVSDAMYHIYVLQCTGIDRSSVGMHG